MALQDNLRCTYVSQETLLWQADMHLNCLLTHNIVLLQAYVSRTRLESFSLTADMMYISQNAPRIARALFEITLRRGWSSLAELMLTFSKVTH